MRLIDADDVLDLFYVASAGQDKAFVRTVEMVVDDAPTIDAVPVVRCKDCFSCTPILKKSGEVYFYRCDYYDIEIEENDFCSRGERKDGAEDG